MGAQYSRPNATNFLQGCPVEVLGLACNCHICIAATGPRTVFRSQPRQFSPSTGHPFLKAIDMKYFQDACIAGNPSIEVPIRRRAFSCLEQVNSRLWSRISVESQRPGSHPRSRPSGGAPLSIFNDDNMSWQFQPGEPEPNVSGSACRLAAFLGSPRFPCRA